jgi:hypothetical protein
MGSVSAPGLTLDEQKKLLALCLDVLRSVSKANLARRGNSLSRTQVNPFAIRALADYVEKLIPGALDQARS